MNQTLTGHDFLQQLSAGSLNDVVLVEGFAEPIEEADDAFLFSPGVSCKSWTKIPAHIVATVTALGSQSCRDHDHAYVRIQFNQASPGEPLAVVLAALLRSLPGESLGLPANKPPPGCASLYRKCFYEGNQLACEQFFDTCR